MKNWHIILSGALSLGLGLFCCSPTLAEGEETELPPAPMPVVLENVDVEEISVEPEDPPASGEIKPAEPQEPVQAEPVAPQGTFLLQGKLYAPKQVTYANRSCISLRDPEILRFLGQTDARLSWSSTSGMLMVYTPLHVTTITVARTVKDTEKNTPSTVSVDGQKCASPGNLYCTYGKGGELEEAFIEPDLLLKALNLHPLMQDNGLVLQPIIEAPSLAYGYDGPVIELQSTMSVRWSTNSEEYRDEQGDIRSVVQVSFPGCYCDLPHEPFYVSGVKVQLEDKEQPTFRLELPPHWRGMARRGLKAGQTVVSCRPTYATKARNLGQLSSIDLGERSLTIKADTPFQYAWFSHMETAAMHPKEEPQRCLLIDIPGLDSSAWREKLRQNQELRPASTRWLPLSLWKQDNGKSKFPDHAYGPGGLYEISEMGTEMLPICRIAFRLQPQASVAWESQAEEGRTTNEKGELTLRFDELGDQQFVASGFNSTTGFIPSFRGTVVLDPGHGGGDNGAVNRYYRAKEKDLTLDIALRLRDLLEADGWTVLMTRQDDRDVSWLNSPDRVELQARCDVANKVKADLFISIHINANSSPQPHGSSVYWYKSGDDRLARAMNASLGARLGLRDIGVLRDGFYVLRHTTMPAVLLELAFISNNEDVTKLLDPEFRQQVATNLAEALAKYDCR